MLHCLLVFFLWLYIILFYFHFRDDPSRIGPFLTVYDELDRMYRTNRIGLFETIWKFKSVLPNIIPDFVSGEFLVIMSLTKHRLGL